MDPTLPQNSPQFEYALPTPFQPNFLEDSPAPRNYSLTAIATDNAAYGQLPKYPIEV